MKKNLLILLCLLFSLAASAQDKLKMEIESVIKSIEDEHYETYKYLHAHPELSLMEFETSKKMAQHLGDMGFRLTRGFGGNSVVGLLENGDGPVIMLRTDMDALWPTMLTQDCLQDR